MLHGNSGTASMLASYDFCSSMVPSDFLTALCQPCLNLQIALSAHKHVHPELISNVVLSLNSFEDACKLGALPELP